MMAKMTGIFGRRVFIGSDNVPFDIKLGRDNGMDVVRLGRKAYFGAAMMVVFALIFLYSMLTDSRLGDPEQQADMVFTALLLAVIFGVLFKKLAAMPLRHPRIYIDTYRKLLLLQAGRINRREEKLAADQIARLDVDVTVCKQNRSWRRQYYYTLTAHLRDGNVRYLCSSTDRMLIDQIGEKMQAGLELPFTPSEDDPAKAQPGWLGGLSLKGGLFKSRRL